MPIVGKALTLLFLSPSHTIVNRFSDVWSSLFYNFLTLEPSYNKLTKLRSSVRPIAQSAFVGRVAYDIRHQYYIEHPKTMIMSITNDDKHVFPVENV